MLFPVLAVSVRFVDVSILFRLACSPHPCFPINHLQGISHPGLTVWVTAARGMNKELITVHIMGNSLRERMELQRMPAVRAGVVPILPPEVVTTQAHQAAAVSSIV